MNDLNFGALLLSCFACLVVGVAVEVFGAAQQSASPRTVARAPVIAASATRASAGACTVALAPTASR